MFKFFTSFNTALQQNPNDQKKISEALLEFYKQPGQSSRVQISKFAKILYDLSKHTKIDPNPYLAVHNEWTKWTKGTDIDPGVRLVGSPGEEVVYLMELFKAAHISRTNYDSEKLRSILSGTKAGIMGAYGAYATNNGVIWDLN
jgi:hypothetical protein